jgi:hypothetical protein
MYKRPELVGAVMLPVIISFAVSGLTQSTFVLADNTFFITAFYLLSQIRFQQT